LLKLGSMGNSQLGKARGTIMVNGTLAEEKKGSGSAWYKETTEEKKKRDLKGGHVVPSSKRCRGEQTREPHVWTGQETRGTESHYQV